MVIPYLTFHGACAQALDFYVKAFDAAPPRILPYGNYVPEGLEHPPENLSTWIMHAEAEFCGNPFWFADELSPVQGGDNVKLTLSVKTVQEAQPLYRALSSGGTIVLPPTETFYSAFHAAFMDRFGVSWNIVSEEPPKS